MRQSSPLGSLLWCSNSFEIMIRYSCVLLYWLWSTLWNTVEPTKYLIYNKRLLHLLRFRNLLMLLSTVLNTFSNYVRFRFAWFGKVLNKCLTQSAEHSVQLATQFIVLRVWGNNCIVQSGSSVANWMRKTITTVAQLVVSVHHNNLC